jgi:hypothetical protein
MLWKIIAFIGVGLITTAGAAGVAQADINTMLTIGTGLTGIISAIIGIIKIKRA